MIDDPVPHTPTIPFLPAFWTATAAIASAAIAAVATWLAHRLVGKAAVQNAINEGFKGLLDRVAAQEESCREELAAIKEEFEAAKIASSLRDARFRGAIAGLQQTIQSLVSLLRERGIPLPEHIAVDPVPPLLLDDGSVTLFQEAPRDYQGS